MSKLKNAAESAPLSKKPAPTAPSTKPSTPLSMDERPTPEWAKQVIEGMRNADPNNLPETP